MVRASREKALAMNDPNFPGWRPEKSVQMVEGAGVTRVLVKGQPYMSWPSGDEECVRLAIVQLYECGLGDQEDLAEAFGRHVNSVRRYITGFACEGMRGVMSERRGPKGRWKITPELRGKILLIVLREGIGKLEAIQQRLAEAWQEVVSLPSIQQVLEEDGLREPPAGDGEDGAVQGELLGVQPERQLCLSFDRGAGEGAEGMAGSSDSCEPSVSAKGQVMAVDA